MVGKVLGTEEQKKWCGRVSTAKGWSGKALWLPLGLLLLPTQCNKGTSPPPRLLHLPPSRHRGRKGRALPAGCSAVLCSQPGKPGQLQTLGQKRALGTKNVSLSCQEDLWLLTVKALGQWDHYGRDKESVHSGRRECWVLSRVKGILPALGSEHKPGPKLPGSHREERKRISHSY